MEVARSDGGIMKHNKNLTTYARELRFLRQKIIENYIVDFYCSKANFVIEIGGGQHYQDKNIISDELRTKTLEQYSKNIFQGFY